MKKKEKKLCLFFVLIKHFLEMLLRIQCLKIRQQLFNKVSDYVDNFLYKIFLTSINWSKAHICY